MALILKILVGLATFFIAIIVSYVIDKAEDDRILEQHFKKIKK